MSSVLQGCSGGGRSFIRLLCLLSVDCAVDRSVTVRWAPALGFSQTLDPGRALLGNCAPIHTQSHTLLFRTSLERCGFIRQVSADSESFSSVLIYDPRPDLPFISQPVQCTYPRSVSPLASAADADVGPQQLLFLLQMMSGDFSAAAPSLRFPLGSRIPIRAAVQSGGPGPLRLFIESCVTAPDAELSRSATVQPVISNSGCLLLGNSSFAPRRRPDELLLSLQASALTVGQKIFLHCELKAWVDQSLDVHGKACQYMQTQHRWVLLDDPAQSYACSCCESTCTPRDTEGVSARRVVGPFIIVDESGASLDTHSSPEHGLREAPVWVLVLSVSAALIIITAVLAFSYYLCFWRGGRLGYRPSRDLLSKY
ncbi:zona pellucida sperm-binding protein 3 isoform X4 [Danio rerio]|uniref:Zona pellucida sperm-binding protein 3 isoform X4 n=1 Tax=Danio rerio TaxID=7955 RepID=A0AC58JMX5_DANRE